MIYNQDSGAKKLQSILYGTDSYAGLNNYLNISWKDFYRDIFNIFTANTVGLNIWGEILNTGRQYYFGTQEKTFGFDVNPKNTTDYAQNFNHGTFTSGGSFTVLSDDEYRCLLMLRARTFKCNGSILQITSILNDFFINLKKYDTSSNQDYDIKVSVTPDPIIPFRVNYKFIHKTTPSNQLPLWINAIFIKNNFNQVYLPIPIGGYANISII